MNYWHGKRAVIVGGSTGLGWTLAERLVRHGARLVLAARNSETLEQSAQDLRKDAGDIVTVPMDVTRQADVERLAEVVVSRLGGVDFFCHCAGRSMRGEVLMTPIAEFQSLWEVNFLGAVRGIQALVPQLSEQAHVVLIGSLASKFAARYLGAYPATKFPLAALAQQLRLEIGPTGKHVLLVCPGPVARGNAEPRYAANSNAPGIPAAAHRPGGGAKLRGIDPDRLAAQILTACEWRQAELIVPRWARILCVIGQMSPRLGDWILKKWTTG